MFALEFELLLTENFEVNRSLDHNKEPFDSQSSRLFRFLPLPKDVFPNRLNTPARDTFA
jgi:hypothetical protein